MKRPTYQQILALVTDLIKAHAEDTRTEGMMAEGARRDQLVGIVLRHVDSWAAKP